VLFSPALDRERMLAQAWSPSFCYSARSRHLLRGLRHNRKPPKNISWLGSPRPASTRAWNWREDVDARRRDRVRNSDRLAIALADRLQHLRLQPPLRHHGITYNGQLRLRSAQINYDWFPFHGAFHLSPGVLVYNGNRITAGLLVPSGKNFNLDHSTFRSDPTDPIRGNAAITFEKVAPAFLLGWGNLIPRRSRHFSFPFEFGFHIMASPSSGSISLPKAVMQKGVAVRTSLWTRTVSMTLPISARKSTATSRSSGSIR
jgi:hypothetical protein